MTSDEIASAIDDAKCVDTCIPKGLQMPVLIVLFAQNAGVAVNTDALIASATCVSSCIPPGMQMPVLISLAQQILNNGGGGGGSNNISGAGSPVGVVTPTATNQFYRDTTNNALWQSTGLTTADWIQWI